MARYMHFKVWLDGKIVNPEEATLSVFTLTVLRGANVYEGLRAYWNPAKRDLYVWKLDEHLRRLGHSPSKLIRVQLPYSLDNLRVTVAEWLRANDFHDDVHFRLVACFGNSSCGGVEFVSARRDRHRRVHPRRSATARRQARARARDGRGDVAPHRQRHVVPARVKAGANYQNNRLAAVEAGARTDSTTRSC